MLSVLAGLAVGAETAQAAPVDNPGDARFYNATGPYPFFTFASSEDLEGSTEQFEAYADSTGDIYFNSASTPFHATAQFLNALSVNIEAQLFIVDVTGIVDLSSGIFFDWQITAQVRFRTSSGGVTSSNCRTASFTIDIAGDWSFGATSNGFTIPSLSGSGTGACNGHSNEINSDFALGSAGATLTLEKWHAVNLATGLALTGS